MLIRFHVTNHLSFRDEVTLSLLPSKSRLLNDHLLQDRRGKAVEVLPLLALYGANASGKSNLVKSLAFLRRLVLRGTLPEQVTGVSSFRLSKEHEKAPSRFEIEFKAQGVLYTYGVVLSPRRVEEEWLFAHYSAQESRLFERITTSEGKTEVQAGRRLLADVKRGEFIQFVAQGTRENQLFLYEAYNRDVALIKPVIKWFRASLHLIGPDSEYDELSTRAHQDERFMEFMSHFLSAAGTGIHRLRCEREPLDKSAAFLALPDVLRERLRDELSRHEQQHITVKGLKASLTLLKDPAGEPVVLRLRTTHLTSDGMEIFFEPEVESDGTRRLMDLAPLLADIWEDEQVFVIDELDRSLHPHLSRLFAETCLEVSKRRTSPTQFVITTHDTHLLDRHLLRRDEIAFMEKDRQGASHLTSLHEYMTSDGLNFENGYLNGRFGAIPFIGDLSKLFEGSTSYGTDIAH